MRDIPVFEARHDCTHPPTGEPNYQESALFFWYDLNSGLAGFWRLGQEPEAGSLNSCFGIFTSDGLRFRSNVTGEPLGPLDRGDTHMGWGSALRVDLDQLAIRADFPDCEASLQFEDFFPRYDYFQLVNAPIHPGDVGRHFEVAGRMTGVVRLGNAEIEVDALGYRDRSWGKRGWGGLRSTRWWPCVFGPDLCMHSLSLVHENGWQGRYGYMIRDGVPYAMTDPDSAVTLDFDAIGPRSGQLRFGLEQGEGGEIIHERHDGIMMHVRGYTAIESIGTARFGDRVGISNLEVCTNPAGGTREPTFVLAANTTNGLTRR